MPDKPIIFSAPMVRALLAGSKMQTRRALKPQPGVLRGDCGLPAALVSIDGYAVPGRVQPKRFPYAPGDRLYVREAHALVGNVDPPWVIYRASGYDEECIRLKFSRPVPPEESIRWRPSIHMPRWASRITLTVTEVRVQRLQEISEADAVAEGIVWQEPTEEDRQWARDKAEEYGWEPQIDGVWIAPGTRQGYGPKPQRDNPQWGPTAAFAYRCLWNSLHGPDAWDANPWVAAISFTVRQGNIDQ